MKTILLLVKDVQDSSSQTMGLTLRELYALNGVYSHYY
jgi:hypothetical protein